MPILEILAFTLFILVGSFIIGLPIALIILWFKSKKIRKNIPLDIERRIEDVKKEEKSRQEYIRRTEGFRGELETGGEVSRTGRERGSHEADRYVPQPGDLPILPTEQPDEPERKSKVDWPDFS